jgi:hypothetical protein
MLVCEFLAAISQASFSGRPCLIFPVSPLGLMEIDVRGSVYHNCFTMGLDIDPNEKLKVRVYLM